MPLWLSNLFLDVDSVYIESGKGIVNNQLQHSSSSLNASFMRWTGRCLPADSCQAGARNVSERTLVCVNIQILFELFPIGLALSAQQKPGVL
jgi:hypothetical protein